MDNNRLKIGEFSRLCKVTVRTLRHYEKINLLVPEIVDKSTGYRYYTLGQLQKMETILSIKSMGFTLEEIKDMWYDDTHAPSVDNLEQKLRECESELKKLQERHRMLKDLIAARNKINNMETIFIESIPAITVATHRAVICSYQDLGRLCCDVIGPEMMRLGCECPEPGYCYTIEHGDYSPTEIDIEYCERVLRKGSDSELIRFKDVPEVPKAACMKVFGDYSNIHQSYLNIFEWIEKEGYKIVGEPRACYIDGIWNQEDPEKWLTILQVPIA